MIDEEQELIYFKYRFVFNDGVEKEFEIKLNPETLDVIRDTDDHLPDWTLSKNFCCEICPESQREYKHCPVAVNLKDVIDFFSNMPSYEQAQIFVSTNERQYYKKTSIQVGVSSLIGIKMSASGCPILAKLKPMVRFHLPFASLEETEFRVLTMFLLAQYFRKKNGLDYDFDLNELKNIYQDIQRVNHSVAKKIADLEKRDTSINAVVVLNNFADYVTFSIDEMDFNQLEKFFKVYIS